MFLLSATDLICAYNERYAFGLGKLTNLQFFTKTLISVPTVLSTSISDLNASNHLHTQYHLVLRSVPECGSFSSACRARAGDSQ